MQCYLAATASGVENRYDALTSLDYTAITLYFIFMMGMGYYFSRRQHSTEEYFVAGRNMPWWAVGISIFATLLSTITYLAVPGEMIKHGVAALANMLAFPLIFVVVGFIIIPYFMRMRATSAYEYLEKRFDISTRLFAAVLFALIRLSWMGIVVFTASRALAKIANIKPDYVWLVALAVGIIAIVYTTMGGVRAVIWTDVVQFIILMGGAIFTVIFVAIATGEGPGVWWENATATAVGTTEDRSNQPLWSWDPFERLTYGGAMIQMFFWWVCTASSDQVAIQRYFSTPSVAAARRAFAANLVAGVTILVLLALCGIALLSYYQGHLPDTPDQVFPHFIRHGLPRGVAGLVVAALFAAAMSSLDSGMNSISTVATVDFYHRFCKTKPDPKTELFVARLITFVAGCVSVAICVMLAAISEEKRGNITDVTNNLNTFIVGGLGGLFFIAIFQRRCTGPQAIASAMLGMMVGLVLGWGHYWEMYGVIKPAVPIKFSWMWIIPISSLVTLASGAILGQVFGSPRQSDESGAP